MVLCGVEAKVHQVVDHLQHLQSQRVPRGVPERARLGVRQIAPHELLEQVELRRQDGDAVFCTWRLEAREVFERLLGRDQRFDGPGSFRERRGAAPWSMGRAVYVQ